VTDILATNPDICNRHLEGTIIYRDRHYHGNITDMTKGAALSVPNILKATLPDHDRDSLKRAINCVLLQNTVKETRKSTDKLKSSRLILMYFCLINPTEYRVHTVLT